MANPFDQFDEAPQQQAAPPSDTGDTQASQQNPFDQFDQPAPSVGQQQAQPAAQSNPFDQFDPQGGAPSEDHLISHFHSLQSSPGGAFARQAALAAPVVAGSLPAIGWGAAGGAEIGTMVGGPVGGAIGGVVGGAAGALGAGYLVANARDWVLDKLGLANNGGMFSHQQAEADLQQNPYWSLGGSLAANALAFNPAAAVSKTARVAGAGIFGGLEAGQEFVQEGKVDPSKVALAAGAGALMPEARPWAEKAMGAGARFMPGRPDVKPSYDPNKLPVVIQQDKAAVQQNQAVKAAAGTADQNTPVNTKVDVGNNTNPPTRDAGNTGKYKKAKQPKQAAPVQTAESATVTQGDLSPDVKSAMTEPRPAPAQPPEAQAQAQPPAPASTDVLGKAPAVVYPHPEMPGVTIDRQSNVSTLSGLNGNKVMVDRSVPPSIDVAGKPLDPALPLAVREHAIQAAKAAFDEHQNGAKVPAVERIATANRIGDQAEAKWLQDRGYDVDAYHNTMDAIRAGAAAPTKPVTAAVTKPKLAEGPVPKQVTEPKVVSAARAALQQKGWTRALERFENLPDEMKPQAARAVLEGIGNKRQEVGLKGRTQYAAARIPSKPAQVEGMEGVTARSKADAARKSGAIAAARDAFNKFGPTSEIIPTSKADIAALKERLQAALAHATEQNGGKDPIASYRPAKKPAEYQWLRAAKRLVNGRMTPKQVAAFVADEKLWRSGRKEDAAIAGSTNRIEADIAKRRAPTVEQAELGQTNSGDFDPVEARGKQIDEVQQIGRDHADIAADQQHEYGGIEGSADAHRDNLFDTLTENGITDSGLRDEARAAFDKRMREHGHPPFPGEVVPAEDVQGKPMPVQSREDVAKMDFASMSDEDLAKLAEQQGVEESTQPRWKVEAAQRAVKMAAQKAARLARDEKGSVRPPNEEPPAAYNRFRRDVNAKKASNPSLSRQLFMPETVSKAGAAAAAIIRAKGGEGARILAKVVHDVEPFRRLMNSVTTGERRRFMMDLDDGRGIDVKLRPVGNVFQKAFFKVKKQLLDLPSQQRIDFLQNYFPHMFENENKAEEFVADWIKQGSSGSTKHREFPTLRQAVAAGMKLKSDDPVEMLFRYMGSMQQYIHSVQVLEDGVASGVVISRGKSAVGPSGHPSPSIIPEGYSEIKGRTLVPGERMYAPSDWARVYNTYIDAGFRSNATRSALYDNLLMASNAATSLELGLSPYHLFTMVKEAIINQVGNGVAKLASGNLSGLGTLGKAAAAPVSLYKLGKYGQKVYLGELRNVPPEIKNVIDKITKSGGRMVGRAHDPAYQYSRAGSFFDAWKRGALRLEVEGAKQRIRSQDEPEKQAWQIAKEVATVVGRTLQTVSQPLFDEYIPALKAGAFMENFSTWLKENPMATEKEQLAMARKIGDSVDNRFGEMVHDNIFWGKQAKQAAQVALRSYSWNLGTVREIGGGSISLLKSPSRLKLGKDYDPKAAYVVAMPVVVGLVSSLYQFLKTGKMPDEATDFAAPKTGGYATVGGPERAIMPGYEKDVFGWYHDPKGEAFNKFGALPRAAYETLVTGEDYRGLPIATGGPDQSILGKAKDYLLHALEAVTPISVRQVAKGPPLGSNISNVERAMAIRPAPTWMENPALIEAIKRRREYRDWRTLTRANARDKALNR